MVRHIVFWKMRETAEGNDAETNIKLAMAELDRIWPTYPAMKDCKWHRGMKHGGKNWDLVLEMVFDDLDAVSGWAQYPMHVELHHFAEKVREDRAVIDYEI